MNLEERLRDAASAIEGMWADPEENRLQLARLHQRLDQPLPQSNEEATWLTVAEAAAVLKVRKMTVYRLVHSGHLPAVREGRSFHVLETDVHALTEEAKRVEAATAPKPAPMQNSRQAAGRDQRPSNEVTFLTVAEVAAVMDVAKMTVYRLVNSGHLPAIRVGHSFRIPEHAVHEYLHMLHSADVTGGERS